MPKSGFESWLPSCLAVREQAKILRMKRQPAYSREDAAAAVAGSHSFSETLRKLGLRDAGGNHRTLRRHLERWGISTAHFDPRVGRRRANDLKKRPLTEILTENSSYSRGHLKERLYAAGLKKPECELCGQGSTWRGREMSLVLDHINGVADDHRLENLQVVCPNCAATLDTHCGKNLGLRQERACSGCGGSFRPACSRQRFCSRTCAARRPRPHKRKVERPDPERLGQELSALGYCGVARRYGVSDNAVRKWVRQHDRAAPQR